MKTGRAIFLVVGLCAALGGVYVAMAPTPEAAPPQEKKRGLQTPWRNESQYIVEMICTDLLEMSYFAGHSKALAAGPDFLVSAEQKGSGSRLVYHLQATLPAGPFEMDLPVRGPIWAPATYLPWAQKMLFEQAPELATQADVSLAETLDQLTSPQAMLLARLDKQYSQELQVHFASPSQHERAALLLESLALREAAGIFNQPREEMNRACAHLAFADALRVVQHSSAGPPRQLAEAGLSLLYNNQADALKVLQSVPPDGAQAVWKRALTLRASGDYRAMEKSKKLSLWEEIELFRALCESVGVQRAWQRVGPNVELTDYYRLANQAEPGPGIQISHQLLNGSLPAELAEWKEVWAQAGFGAPDKEGLNAEPGRCVSPAGVRIIGKGIWAAHVQRHICHALVCGYQFLYDRYGDPEQAADFRQRAQRDFGALRLYPFVARQLVDNPKDYRQAQDVQLEVIKRSPQAIPAGAWNMLSFDPPYCKRYLPGNGILLDLWHSMSPPPGTAMQVRQRINHMGLRTHPEQLKQLHLLAPYDWRIAKYVIRFCYADNASQAVLKETYGPLLDYYPMFCMRMAQAPDQDLKGREMWVRRACQLEPSYGCLLGDMYRDQGREKEAARAYLAWIATEQDEVTVSHYLGWLVQYFEKTGDSKQATALAERAAATGSGAGLLSKAHLLEKRKQYPAALGLYQENLERYDSPGPLLGFLMRLQAAGSKGPYKPLQEKLVKHYFPDGLQRYVASAAAPSLGAAARYDLDPLHSGDVVVALQGWRVTSAATFTIIKKFEAGQPLQLLVWRGSGYEKLKPVPADTSLSEEFLDYHP